MLTRFDNFLGTTTTTQLVYCFFGRLYLGKGSLNISGTTINVFESFSSNVTVSAFNSTILSCLVSQINSIPTQGKILSWDNKRRTVRNKQNRFIMPNNKVNWGQAAVNNTNGFGSGASNNSSGWGGIHFTTYGHDETNLTGITQEVKDYINRVDQDGGVVENPNYLNQEYVKFLAYNPTLLNIPSAYAVSKAYSIIPSNGNGDLTWSRASTKTRINSDGNIEEVAINVPALDYSTGTQAWSLEPQRTNLITYSEQFDNAAWGKLGSTATPNTNIAPDGTMTADKLVEDNSTGNHQVSYSLSGLTIGQDLTVTIYAKADIRSQIGIDFVPYGNSVFDVQNGVVVSGSDASITDAGNGWYRCSVTRTLNQQVREFFTHYTMALLHTLETE